MTMFAWWLRFWIKYTWFLLVLYKTCTWDHSVHFLTDAIATLWYSRQRAATIIASFHDTDTLHYIAKCGVWSISSIPSTCYIYAHADNKPRNKHNRMWSCTMSYSGRSTNTHKFCRTGLQLCYRQNTTRCIFTKLKW